MLNRVSSYLGLIGVVILFLTRKMQEDKKPHYIVLTQYVSMALIIILGGYSQYLSSQENKKYKQASHEVAVLSQVSEEFIPTIENIAKIENNMLAVKNYLSYEEAKKAHPELAVALDWKKDASESRVAEFGEAIKAFNKIKTIAAEIVRINIEHKGVIPTETLGWASLTLSLKFEEIEQYFDPYAPFGKSPNDSVLSYHEKTGKAFGLVLGKIRAASNVLNHL